LRQLRMVTDKQPKKQIENAERPTAFFACLGAGEVKSRKPSARKKLIRHTRTGALRHYKMATYKSWKEVLEKDEVILQVSQQHQSGSGSSTYNIPLSLALKSIIEPLQKGNPYWNPENDKWHISYPKEEAEIESVKAELEAVKAELEAVKKSLALAENRSLFSGLKNKWFQ
jgi:hypothetical protein